ncbi:hypothetical protein H4R18_004053 [Coemansia javaensis]|uniref:Thioredoxin domain-containing protein n=1 Tax=Coemansia javaensis TaxID=2761396 RepID=A0A9W8HA44_9FUNG|nr:hypothetical protein H4R18_004053 [Coemansia javaensis]
MRWVREVRPGFSVGDQELYGQMGARNWFHRGNGCYVEKKRRQWTSDYGSTERSLGPKPPAGHAPAMQWQTAWNPNAYPEPEMRGWPKGHPEAAPVESMAHFLGMDGRIKEAARLALDEGDDALSDDEILAGLEDDPELERLREERLEQLKREMGRMRELRSSGHGEYSEVRKEEEAVKLIASARRAVVHFVHPQFARCRVLDGHLQALARHHFETRFVSASVERCPFLVQKFQVRVLPCVLVVVDGQVVDRLIGFEEFGNSDGFSTEALEKRLARSGVVELPAGELARVPVRERPAALGPGDAGRDAEDAD